jgi:hypothetical protein
MMMPINIEKDMIAPEISPLSLKEIYIKIRV